MNACILILSNWLCVGCLTGICDLPSRAEATRPAAGKQSSYAITLSIGNPVTIAQESLTIELMSVRDSRCAVEVKCVWAGVAELVLRVGKAGANAESLTLGAQLPAAGGDGGGRYDGYRLALVRLEPANSIAQPVSQTAYRATLEVSTD